MLWSFCNTLLFPSTVGGVIQFAIQTRVRLMLTEKRNMKNIAKKFMMARVQRQEARNGAAVTKRQRIISRTTGPTELS